MRRSLRLLIPASLFLLLVLPLGAAAVPDYAKPGAAEVRNQLSSYFANIAENSPTVLGGLAKSPEAMKAIQDRIGSMSDQEVAQFQKLMSDAPDWKAAPEAVAHAFPPEVLEQVRRVGADYASRVPAGAEMREDVRTLVAVLKVLPDEKLQELGVTRQMVDSLDATFTQMSPLQAAMLHRQATTTGAWAEGSATAMNYLPPALQRGAAALAAHGPLTEKDLAELDQFRAELTGLLERIDKLPPETRKTLKADMLRGQLDQLSKAPPDVVFMVRHHVPPEVLKVLQRNVLFLEKVANLSDREKEELEQFRKDLTHAFTQLDPDLGSEAIEEMLGELGSAHLLMLQSRMAPLGEWQLALPALYQTLASPELPQRLQPLQGPNPDPAAVQSLEAFRQQALSYIDAAASLPDVDPKLVEQARSAVESASLERLEIIRLSFESMPPGASASQVLPIAAMHEINFNCSVDLGCIDLVVDEVCFRFSLDFICNPIEDALETIEHGIVNTVNSIVDGVRNALNTAISAVSNALNAAINAVSDTVNSIISAITDTANSIWSFIQTLPGLAWDAIKAALNLLLDIEIGPDVTVRDLVGRGVEHALTSMKSLMGLAGDWWTAISTFTLPTIPCPPSGFHTPFGDVGDGAAVVTYARYKLLIDGVIGMIPDTETSLFIKIPAQVLYMLFDFLGMCLEQAAAEADSVESLARHTLVLTNFSNLQAFIGMEISGLSAASGSQTTALFTLINTQSSSIQNTVMNQSSAIQTLINNESTEIQNLINNKSTMIQNLVQNESDTTQANVDAFKRLNVRLIIERVLQEGVGNEVAHFQLKEPWGHLTLVSEIVRETISAMMTAQEGTGQAQKFFDKGMELMDAGNYKEAFKQFAFAYRETTK